MHCFLILTTSHQASITILFILHLKKQEVQITCEGHTASEWHTEFGVQVSLTPQFTILLARCAQSSARAWWVHLLQALVPTVGRDGVIDQNTTSN